MSTEWVPFDLPDDADERAIKRAYAQRLKTTRPDEDPEGFQRLREAYEAALRACARRAADAAPAHAPAHAPAKTQAGTEAGARDADAAGGPAGEARRPDADSEVDASLDTAFDTSPDTRLHTPPDGPLDRDGGIPEAVPYAIAGADARFGAWPAGAWPAGAWPVGAWPEHGRGPLPSPFAASAVASDPWAAQALAEQVLSMAAVSDPDTLTAWLQAQPGLWSLPDKAAIADAVVDALQFDRPPMGVAQFDALAGFFGLFDLQTGHATDLLLAVRERLALAEALEGGDPSGLAERLHPAGASRAASRREIRRLLQQLRRPWSWPQALTMALVPGLPSRLHRFAQILRGMGDGELPDRLEPRQGAFWEAAGDLQRWSWPRAAVLALRLTLYPLALPLLSWLLQPGLLAPEVAGRRYLALFLALGLGWAWLRLGLGFAEWQAVEDPPEARWRARLRDAAIPLLVTLGLCLHVFPGTEPLSWLLVPLLLMGTVARVAGTSYSAEALVLVLRNGWVWVALPLALALFGAFADSGTVRGAVYAMLALVGLGLWFGARSRG